MLNASADPMNNTRNPEDELGRTTAHSQAADDEAFDVFQGEDDIHKYHKLIDAFQAKFKGNSAFNDTFIDEEVYRKTLESEDYLRISVDLLKYIMHSTNIKKKVEPEKKGSGLRVYDMPKR